MITAVGYITYSYVTAEQPDRDTTTVSPDFNGAWNISINPISGPRCSSATVEVNAQNGKMNSMLVTQDGVQSAFSGTIDKDGVIRNNKSANLLSFEGLMYGGMGSGKWSDKYGCAGTFTMRRPEEKGDGIDYTAPKQPSKGLDAELDQKTIE